MIKVEFEYKEGKCFIQATLGEKMRKICSKFAQKSQIDINSFFFYVFRKYSKLGINNRTNHNQN